MGVATHGRAPLHQKRESRFFFAFFHDYVDKTVKRYVLKLWQKYYMFLMQSIA